MDFDRNKHLDDWDDHSNKTADKPDAWRVEDNRDLKEKNLERNLYGKSEHNMKPIMEGRAMGGHSFGKNNNTPSGDDKNNPSQNAGYTNAYLARTEPSEEHLENSNFKGKGQDGEPDYNKAQPYANWHNEAPKPEKVERGNGENDRPHKGNTYYEDAADNEKESYIPDSNELPDQQKVSKDSDEDDIEHIET